MAPCRFPVQDEDNEEEKAGFSGRSCTAFILADCIALCCCPCCLLSFLSLALVKAPYMAGRRLLAGVKKRRSLLKKRKRVSDMETKNGTWEEERKEIEVKGYEMVGFGDEDELESERIWAEFIQIGQWGFGRVSFSKEIQ